MRSYSGAILFSAVLIGCAAAPAHSQNFEFSNEVDLDVVMAVGEADGVREGVQADFRLRSEAEAVTQAGLRWGGALALAARTRDGRRGLQAGGGPSSGPAGLVTGLGGSNGGEGEVIGLERAEVFIRSTLFEIYAGLGPTAMQRERIRPPSVLRLASADGGLVDPLGGALVDTGVSLSAPAPQLTVRTRRLAGFAIAASFAPSGDACGPDRCLDVRYGEVDQIASAVVSFDRRAPSSRTRWSAVAGFEAGRAVAAPLSAALDDPWLVTAQLARETGGVTLSVSGVHAYEGVADAEYSAISAKVSIETGDWLMDAELGRADADLAGRDGWTAQTGVSRFVGDRGVAGAAIRLQTNAAAALIFEAGLRF